jgi:ribosome-associated toxin RatA of RatAB toxin-antitoxin module
MRDAQVTILVADAGPATTFERISDFAAYPDLIDVVRSVSVRPVGPGEDHSDWEVFFRNGILRWTEVDRFDADALTITFEQLEGDFAEFAGTWVVTPHGTGSAVAFTAAFDFGIPSLAGLLDPIAERVLKETIVRAVAGLFDRVDVLGDDASLALAAGVR